MNLTAWVNSIIGGRYKLVEQSLEGDKQSNVVVVRQIYSVPRLRNREKVVCDFQELRNSLEIIQDGLRIKVYADGWQTPQCSLFGISLYVVPNGGYITYSDPLFSQV